MKKLLVVLGLMVLLCSVAAADSGWWSECYDGELHIWMYRYEVNERLLIQMRPIFEGLGWAVDWNPWTDRIVAVRPDAEIKMLVGSRLATINGQEEYLNAAPRRTFGVIYMPLRFIAEVSGAQVEYLGDIVVITPPDGMVLVVHLI